MIFKSYVYIEKEDDWYIAHSIELGVASQGKSINEAIDNLKEAVDLYLEDNKDFNYHKNIFLTTMEINVDAI